MIRAACIIGIICVAVFAPFFDGIAEYYDIVMQALLFAAMLGWLNELRPKSGVMWQKCLLTACIGYSVLVGGKTLSCEYSQYHERLGALLFSALCIATFLLAKDKGVGGGTKA